MRLFKLVVTLAVIGVIVLFIWQNMETWASPTKYKLNLYLVETGFMLELYIVIFLSAFGGFLVGAMALLKPYMKARRLLVRERQEKKQAEAPAAAKETSAEAS